MQDTYGIQIVDGLGLLAVAYGRMVSSQSQHGIDTECRCGEHIAHDTHTASVTSGNLYDGLQPCFLQLDTKTKGGSLQTG